MDWILDILRSVLLLIDKVIYGFIDIVYSLFIEIANTTLFSNEMINEFAGKVYALVGVFMLFKVSFSVLTYIVNPDEFLDKSKGMSKLITNILTSLVLFLAVPFIFEQAMDIQKIILRDDVIPKLFSTRDINISSQDPADGSNLAFHTFKEFYKPSGPETATNIGDLFNYDVNEKDSSGNYTVEYTFIISTVIGVVIVLLLVSFCFDIALRSVKLGFLRLLAPIPILTRIDPKKGNDVFNKWIKSCTSTYLDLFMRLAAIYFALYIIKSVTNLGATFENAVTGTDYVLDGLTVVFIILGALMFAKQMPKLIEDLLGIRLGGNFTLNPAKKIAAVPVAGKLASTAIGTVQGVASGNKVWDSLKQNWGNVPLAGSDKSSIFDTPQRKIHQEQLKKAYEGKQRQNVLNEQVKEGKKYSDLKASGKSPFNDQFQKSADSVDYAKGLMYSWENYVSKAQADYQAAVTKYGEGSDQAAAAYIALGDANKNYGSAKGQYEYKKQLHDALRQQMPKMAKIEDAIEAYEKYGGGKTIAEPPKVEIKEPQQTSNPNNNQNTNSNNNQSTNSQNNPTPNPPHNPAPSSYQSQYTGDAQNVNGVPISAPTANGDNVTTPQGVILQPGERSTPSGIIIPNGVNITNNNNSNNNNNNSNNNS